jgi:hypothetical protein
LEKGDGLPVPAQPQIAIREQVERLLAFGVVLAQFGELIGGPNEICLLVERECKVEAHQRVLGIVFQCRAILSDGIRITADVRQGYPEIRPRLH